MVAALLDTSVLIDVIRKHAPAENWLSNQNGLGVSHVVALEMLAGAKNRVGQRDVARLLSALQRVELNNDDFLWALTQMERYGLSHHVGSMDCLIASTAFRLQVPLYTRNLKHFAPMLGELAQQPY